MRILVSQSATCSKPLIPGSGFGAVAPAPPSRRASSDNGGSPASGMPNRNPTPPPTAVAAREMRSASTHFSQAAAVVTASPSTIHAPTQ